MVNSLKRRVCLMLLVSGAVMVMTGCGSGKKAAEAETAAVLVDAVKMDALEGADKVAESEGTLSPETQAAAESGEAAPEAEMDDSVRVLSGIVKDAGTGTVTVTSERYPDGVTFNKEDAVTHFEDGLLPDRELTLFYQGEIKSGDTSEVTVVFIRDKREKDEESQAAMMSGKVTGIGMSVITIETDDGKSVSFEQDPKPVNMTDGPQEGDQITILYSYNDEGGDGAVVPELIR